MAESSDDKTLVVLEAESNQLTPTPSRIDLKTIDDVRLEMARVYREMRARAIESQEGTKLVYVLSQIGKLIELHELEQRVELLERNNLGGT